MARAGLIVLSFAVVLRVSLVRTPVAEWLSQTNEVSTPLTSWKRVTEGLALYKAGISPYDGDVFHEMPLVLRVFNYFNNVLGPSIDYLFVVCDIILALLLDRIAKLTGKYLLEKQAVDIKKYSTSASGMILKSSYLKASRFYVLVAYLYNPYSVAACVSKSTALFNNMAVALAILFTLQGSRPKACFAVAVAAYMSMYPIMLIVPTAIHLAQKDIKEQAVGKKLAVSSVVQTILCTIAGLGLLMQLSYMLEGSWNFLYGTYGFILTVPDLTPNMGVFWYFFTEMFEHFRLFFICVFQINAFIYTVPLAIKLRDQPIFMMYVLVALMAIFKSYPSYADAALYISLIPLWRHVFDYMRNNLVIGCMFMVSSVLAPILWYLWIYAGSANANFYFAITLVYSTAQIFLITDIVFGHLRRDYDLIHGPKRKDENGQQQQIILE